MVTYSNIEPKESLNYYSAVARNILIFSELENVLLAFKKAEIPVIVLKGAALAATIYPDISCREMGDVDLLVRPEERELARDILELEGYYFIPESEKGLSPFDSAFTGEMAFRKGDGALFELHWELTPVEWLRQVIALDNEALWDDALPIKINSMQVLQLSPCDMLLHLCIHLTAHNYAHPVGFRDIVQLLKFHTPFPWDAFVDRAIAFRLRTLCYFPLFTACLDLGANVPQAVLDALRPSSFLCKLISWIANPKKGLTGELKNVKPRGYLVHLIVADQQSDALQVFFWLLFPGSRWLAERYRLKGLWRPWLACFWHPFFVLWQGFLGLREVAAGRAG